jgi:1-acyl-sn-glycerol-3-phosphate acyltransferase
LSSNKSSNSKKKKARPIGNFLYDFVKITGALPALIWMRPKVIHLGNKQTLKGGFMASANHCSFVDPILIHCVFWKRRMYSLATKDLYSSKLRQWFFDQVHCIQVDKQNFSLNSFHEVTRQLKQGKVVSIYPEGQLNRASQEMLAFKSGVILMAHSAKVPIVPVYLVPPGRWYQRRIAIVGQPIDVRALCGDMPTVDDLNRAGDYVHQQEQQLREFYHKAYKKQELSSQDTAEQQKEVIS